MEPKLRDEIDSLRHKNIAKKQLELHKEKLKIRSELVRVANGQLKSDPAHRDAIVDSAQTTLDIANIQLQKDRDHFVELQDIEKQLREDALTHFIRSHHFRKAS